MTFNEKKSIFLQIADKICEDILNGTYKEEQRIPSVRETAVDVEVNSNTVMRTYDYLQGQGIIYCQRGLGYFVSKGAQEAIRNVRKEEFVKETLPEIAHTMRTLGITIEEVSKKSTTFCNFPDSHSV